MDEESDAPAASAIAVDERLKPLDLIQISAETKECSTDRRRYPTQLKAWERARQELKRGGSVGRFAPLKLTPSKDNTVNAQRAAS